MMNPTTLTFERDANSDFDNCIYCKMVVRYEETHIEVNFTLTDENGLHRYKASFDGSTFDHSFIPRFIEMFETYAYTDGNVTADGWLCVHNLRQELVHMF